MSHTEALPLTVMQHGNTTGDALSRVVRIDLESGRIATYLDGLRTFMARQWLFTDDHGNTSSLRWDDEPMALDVVHAPNAVLMAFSGETNDDHWAGIGHDQSMIAFVVGLVQQGRLSPHSVACALVDLPEIGVSDELVVHAGDFFDAARDVATQAERAKSDHERSANAGLYVVEFSTGVVKVGRATDVPSRIKQHRSDAAKFGVSMCRTWESPRHRHNVATERRLIESCADIAVLAGGKEYFRIDFEHAVELAQKVDLEAGVPAAKKRSPPGDVVRIWGGVPRAEMRWNRLSIVTRSEAA
jgi:hypothetical protein